MVILEAIGHETIWGGEKLIAWLNGKGNKIGHLYSLQCEEAFSNKILNGKYVGRDFNTYFDENKERFGLGGYKLFPLVIALVEACQNLSIQVHPDDETAKKEENASFGKNESWYFLEPPISGQLYNGCRVKDIEQVKQLVLNGRTMEAVDNIPVRAGDYVYVEAGTLHALSAGSFLYEIEENSPWTYRIYDYDRVDDCGNKRELHLDKALKALKPNLRSCPFALGDSAVEERMYTVRRMTGQKYVNQSSTLECFTMIDGHIIADGMKVTGGTTVVLEPGECVEGEIGLAVIARPKINQQIRDTEEEIYYVNKI